jgi:hypothetical protein
MSSQEADAMSTVIDNNLRNYSPPTLNSLTGLDAANDAHLPKPASPLGLRDTAESGGWNAYDGWRKLIKEARERRDSKSGSAR